MSIALHAVSVMAFDVVGHPAEGMNIPQHIPVCPPAGGPSWRFPLLLSGERWPMAAPSAGRLHGAAAPKGQMEHGYALFSPNPEAPVARGTSTAQSIAASEAG